MFRSQHLSCHWEYPFGVKTICREHTSNHRSWIKHRSSNLTAYAIISTLCSILLGKIPATTIWMLLPKKVLSVNSVASRSSQLAFRSSCQSHWNMVVTPDHGYRCSIGLNRWRRPGYSAHREGTAGSYRSGEQGIQPWCTRNHQEREVGVCVSREGGRCNTDAGCAVELSSNE